MRFRGCSALGRRSETAPVPSCRQRSHPLSVRHLREWRQACSTEWHPKDNCEIREISARQSYIRANSKGCFHRVNCAGVVPVQVVKDAKRILQIRVDRRLRCVPARSFQEASLDLNSLYCSCSCRNPSRECRYLRPRIVLGRDKIGRAHLAQTIPPRYALSRLRHCKRRSIAPTARAHRCLWIRWPVIRLIRRAPP